MIKKQGDYMTYSELIHNISIDNDLSISKTEFSNQHFGSFIVEFKYKNSLIIQILSDRGIIEVSIIVPTLFSSMAVPLKYAVSFVRQDIGQQKFYTFNEVKDAYLFFQSSYDALDLIIRDNLIKSIVNHWKNDIYRY